MPNPTPIRIKKQRQEDNHWRFLVILGPPDDQTKHWVTLTEQYYLELTNGQTAPDQLIVKSFEFLLQREPKESILPKFDLNLIQTYFPDYPDLIKTNQSK